jgi:hypothetical protein
MQMKEKLRKIRRKMPKELIFLTRNMRMVQG